MKKICFITTIPLTIETFVLKCAMFLHEVAGWDISIICDKDEEFAKRLPQFIHYYPVEMKRGISISGISAMLKMRKIFAEQKFDLIQYSTPNASLYAALAGYLANIPVRLYCQWGMVYVGFSGVKHYIFKFMEKIICTLSTWIEPDSKSNLYFAHSEGLYSDRKSSVIWNGSACGIDLEKFNVSNKVEYRNIIRQKHNIPDDAFVYGFVGRLTKDKGVNELFTAYRNLASVDNNSYLLIVGANENDGSVDSSLYEWSKNSDRVIYVGYTKVVEQYLAAMDCYILPSYREGFGMGIVEAEAMELPVIVTNIPGPIDAMRNGETGIIVEKANVGQLQDAMLFFMKNQEIAEKYGKKGGHFASNSFEQKRLFQEILVDRQRLMLLRD